MRAFEQQNDAAGKARGLPAFFTRIGAETEPTRSQARKSAKSDAGALGWD